MKKMQNSYKKSGVDISLANKFVKHIHNLSKKLAKKRRIHLIKIILVALDLYMILVKLKLKIQ